MSTLTPDELESVNKISQNQLTKVENAYFRSPGSYEKIAKVTFSPLIGEIPSVPAEVSPNRKSDLESLQTDLEVIFGKTTLTLKEIAALEKGSLLPLNELCDELVGIYVNGTQIARGEIVAVDNHFGIKIVSFTKN